MQILSEHRINTESLLAGITEQDLSDMRLVVGQKIILRRVIARLSKSTGDSSNPPMATSGNQYGGAYFHPVEDEPADNKVLHNTKPISVPEQVTRPETSTSLNNLTGPEGKQISPYMA